MFETFLLRSMIVLTVILSLVFVDKGEVSVPTFIGCSCWSLFLTWLVWPVRKTAKAVKAAEEAPCHSALSIDSNNHEV